MMRIDVHIHKDARLRGDKEKIKNAIVSIYNREGKLTPEAIIKAAKAKSSPLHNEFTWDAAEALQKVQRSEALYLIRVISLEIKEVDTDKVYHGREYVLNPVNQDEYISIRTALSDSEMREQMIQQLMSRLESLRKELEQFEEFSGVVQAITRAQRKAA